MSVTVPQTEANLLSYLQTGDTPTQDQLEELVRTMFYLYNVVVASAAASEALAEDTLEIVTDLTPKVLAHISTYTSPPGSVPVINSGTGIASVAIVGSGTVNPVTVKITFSTPFDNVYYKALIPSYSTTTGKTVNDITIQTTNSPLATLTLVIFK